MAEKSIEELESSAIALLHQELTEPLRMGIEVLNLVSALPGTDAPGKLAKARIVRYLIFQHPERFEMLYLAC